MAPRVSFIVPCFKLAHFLKASVDSILAQTFEDFEVLIMDDCSPDDTPAVAHTFRDARVCHIRHDANLGHLRNYNRGIELAAGEYIWLISADDALRSTRVLERFVNVLSTHSTASYVFCPAVLSKASADAGVLNAHGGLDRMFSGRAFLETLLQGNRVSAPAALARRACYERAGGFPLDLPFTADWYLWCVFALDGDVGYLAEPMVTYRVHDSNMTRAFLSDPQAMTKNEIAVRWRIRREAQSRGARRVASLALSSLAADYAVRVARFAASGWPYGLQLADVDRSLADHQATERERSHIFAAIHLQVADDAYRRGDLQAAMEGCHASSRMRPSFLRPRVKGWLLRLGPLGAALREGLSAFRRLTRRGVSEPDASSAFGAAQEPSPVSAPAPPQSPAQ